VRSHVKYFPRAQEISVAPSGLLPSSLKSPVGTLVIETSALVSACQIISLMTWCLSDWPWALLHTKRRKGRNGDCLAQPSLHIGSGKSCTDLGPALVRRRLLPNRCREQDRMLPQALRTTNQLSEDCALPPIWPCWLCLLHVR